MQVAENEYYVIENFMDPDYAKKLSDYFVENQVQDQGREFYGFIPFGGRDEFFNNKDFKLDFDPLNKIKEMNHFAYNFFMDKYNIQKEFFMSRSHANIMQTNAMLHSHRDDRNREQSIEDLGNKTYVASLILNDDYTGGELAFGEPPSTRNGTPINESEIIYLKPKAGSLVLFPGYCTWHAVQKVRSGNRVNILSHFFEIIDVEKMNSAYV